MSSYLITGSNRGLGLALTKYLSTLPSSEVSVVFAAARTESAELKELVTSSAGRVVFVHLATTDKASVERAVPVVERALGGKGLDFLINNAGTNETTPNWTTTKTDFDVVFNVNVTGTHLVTAAFLPLLKRGDKKKIANMGSTLGSVAKAPVLKDFPIPAYKVSKAALNALTVQYALALAPEGFVVVVINPGWVQTDMGSSAADISADEAVKAIIESITTAGEKDNGTFRMIHVVGWEKNQGVNQYDGGITPW